MGENIIDAKLASSHVLKESLELIKLICFQTYLLLSCRSIIISYNMLDGAKRSVVLRKEYL